MLGPLDGMSIYLSPASVQERDGAGSIVLLNGDGLMIYEFVKPS
jgi:hypothetical protein